MKRIISVVIIVFLILLIVLILNMGEKKLPKMIYNDRSEIIEVNPDPEDGLIRVAIPENLLGGAKAENAIDPEDPFTKEHLFFTEYIPNEDGTATFVFTEEQYKSYKKRIYNNAITWAEDKSYSIEEVIYEDEMMRGVTVLTNKEQYENDTFTRLALKIGIVMYAGQYQILCGIPIDEWSSTITIIDSETYEIIEKEEFPNDNMYKL